MENVASGRNLLLLSSQVSCLASDSTGLETLLALFPELQKELDLAFKEAVGKVSRPKFQHSKEQVIIAEVFFNKKSDLAENDRRELIALIKDAGSSKELKGRLRNWDSPSGGLSYFLPGPLLSLFRSKEWTSECIDEAVRKSRDIGDWVFLTGLQEKVLREPLLQQLAQDVMGEAYAHLQAFMRHRLPKLYLRAQDIKRKRMYYQVNAEANDQDQKRRRSSRNDWIDEINLAQAQADPGYVSCYLQVDLTLLKCTL